MTIYNINLGIGWASSGVEYAQSYRAKLLRSIGEDIKFIFLDFIQSENIQTLTHNLGFKDNEIIWLYQYFTDIKIAPTSITVEDIIATLDEEILSVEEAGKVKRVFFKNSDSFITCYLKEKDQNIVDRAEIVSNGRLIRKDFYSYVRVFSEYYAPFEQKAKAYLRQFYNEDGSIAYQEYLGNDSIFMINDIPLYGKRAFIDYFFKSLNLSHSDILIVDRAKDIGQEIMENKGESKVGVVVHAEHFSENATDDDYILWNNHYEYQFSLSEEIDFFITATELQKEILTEQFKFYHGSSPAIYAIPVGALDQLSKPVGGRRPFSIITASRLANEKHVDWLVKAVVKAKRYIPQLTFDIYGEGGERGKINQVIHDCHAEDYITMKGHVELTKIYSQYQLFLSASQSEGFGLTLMEAVGSGLGLIGFEVNYGNPTFIDHHKNGYLISVDIKGQSVENITDLIAQRIVEFYNLKMREVQKTSYAIAAGYKKEIIKQKWIELIKEVRHD